MNGMTQDATGLVGAVAVDNEDLSKCVVQGIVPLVNDLQLVVVDTKGRLHLVLDDQVREGDWDLFRDEAAADAYIASQKEQEEKEAAAA